LHEFIALKLEVKKEDFPKFARGTDRSRADPMLVGLGVISRACEK
jgi:hypothetical protein